MNEAEIIARIRQGEDVLTQFKRQAVGVAKLADEKVAFANAEGAVVLFGVDDEGTIIALDDEQEKLINRDLTNAASDGGRPAIYPRTEFHQVDGKLIVAVIVFEGVSKPYANKLGEYWTKERPYRGSGTGVKLAVEVIPGIQFESDREANWLKAIVKRTMQKGIGTLVKFNSTEFGGIRNEAGTNRFLLSVKQWVEKTNSRGIIAKAGRYGGTYAHKDIAFEFASWVSPKFKLYLIRDYQRLKVDEQAQLGWSAKRELAKINYHIHTDAIKAKLIPATVTRAQQGIIYASEADVLNVALFGQTHQQWQLAHPDLKGNQRDYADINQLICISNMENINAVMINDGIPQPQRLKKLNEIAIQQMRILCEVDGGRNLLK